MRSIARLVVLALAVAACGGGTGDGSATATLIEPTGTPGAPSPSPATGGADTDTDAATPPTGTPATPTPTTTATDAAPEPSPPPTRETSEPDQGAAVGAVERATGSGTVTIDGVPTPVSVVACGWLDRATSRPLREDPRARDDFRLLLAAGLDVLDDAFLTVEIDRDGDVGTVRVDLGQVATADSDRANLQWSDLLRGAWRIEVDGARVFTPEPMPIANDSLLESDESHLVGLDVTCETFGGIIDDSLSLLSDEFGVDLTPSGSGTVTVDGTVHDVEVTDCFVSDDGSWEIVATTVDGTLEIEVTDNGLGRPDVFSDQIHLDLGGELYVARRGVDAVRTDGVARLTDPVEVVEIVSEQPFAPVDFEITCD